MRIQKKKKKQNVSYMTSIEAEEMCIMNHICWKISNQEMINLNEALHSKVFFFGLKCQIY